MIVKDIIWGDTVNYRVTSLTIMFPYCTFKCGEMNCQNYALAQEKNIEVNIPDLVQRYIKDDMCEAVVAQGLDPLDSFEDVYEFISELRKYSNDPVVIYTGYNASEVQDKVNILKNYPNIIIKFGRYIPNQKPHKDEILGVNLISDNQYAKKIS